jgi:CheY-like chemotaxis protein
MSVHRHAASALNLLAAICLLSLAWSQPVAAQSPDAEFRNGLAAFDQGKFEEAERHFRNVLKSQPDHEQALRYRDEAGYHFWVKVLARDDRLATVARRILKAAERAAIRERQDVESLRRDMQGLWSDDFREEIETVELLIAKYGHYVVPELVDVLGDRREDDKRVKVISLLARLGDEGTLAVVELLEADSVTLQQNAAVVLGHTGDVRAVPPLKRLAERADDQHVKRAAEGSVGKIGGPSFGTAEYYARVAEAFYQEHPVFLINRYQEYVVWKWQDGKLTMRNVPRHRWNEEVAEEYAYDGLSVAPDDQVLWASLLNTYAQEWTEVEEALRTAQLIQDKGGEVDEEEVESLKELQGKLEKVKMLVASRGPDDVLAALGKAMADQRAPNAIFLIERLQELNIDSSLLAGGGSVTFLPEAERDAGAAPTRPAPAPAPAPRSEPQPAPARDDTPAPTRVEDDDDGDEGAPSLDDDDEGAPSLDDDDGDEGAPSLDDDEGDAPAPRRRRPRRVSQAQPGTVPASGRRAGPRLGYRGGRAALPEDAADGVSHSGPGEIMTGGAALSAALTYGDKRVRYAAAIALAQLNPTSSFANSDQVMVNLIDALGESGQRVILVVERDRGNRNRILGLLRELGYMAFGVEDGRGGLMRTKAFPGEDMVIVSSELNPAGEGSDPLEFQFIDNLREDYRTKHIKVMVLTPEERVDEMQTLVDGGRAVDVVTPDVDKATLNDKLLAAFGNEADQRDEKARSDKIAERAARAIAGIPTGHTTFEIASASAALVKNVRRDSGRPDSVRLACLAALEAIGPAAREVGIEILTNEFQDETNSIEVRRALPRAIGEILKGSEIPGETFQLLKAALGSEDTELWRNAGYALGKAKLTGAQALEVFNEQRLE